MLRHVSGGVRSHCSQALGYGHMVLVLTRRLLSAACYSSHYYGCHLAQGWPCWPSLHSNTSCPAAQG